MVTAGIYLLIRYVDLSKCKYKNIILLTSRLTILFARLTTNFELNLKKIAYLKLRQLGFIMRIFGYRIYWISSFTFIYSCNI